MTTARPPICWLGDATQDCDVWELTRRRERFTILGGPTTLYFAMDDGTLIVVPSGWWIYDWHTEHPFVSSAAPARPDDRDARADRLPEGPGTPLRALIDRSYRFMRKCDDGGVGFDGAQGLVRAAYQLGVADRDALREALRDMLSERAKTRECAKSHLAWRGLRNWLSLHPTSEVEDRARALLGDAETTTKGGDRG